MTSITEDLQKITSALADDRLRLHPEIDPAATLRVAATIVEQLRGQEIDAVACWLSPTNAILAFVVAEALGLPAVQLSEDEGLLYLSWELPPSRIALVGAEGESGRADIARTMFTQAGHEPVLEVVVRPGTESAPGGVDTRAW